MLAVPGELILKILGPNSETTGFLKGSAGDWIAGNMLVANRWTYTGVREPGLFR
jgi:hypothetical protein